MNIFKYIVRIHEEESMKIKGVVISLIVTLSFLIAGMVYGASGDLTVTGNFNLLPPGTVIMYTGSTAPENWVIADGSEVLREGKYAQLFAVMGTTFGAGNGSTTFNLPDFRRRVAVGAGGTGTIVLGNAVGNKGGEESHSLTVAEMPAHSHNFGAYGYNSGGAPQQVYRMWGSGYYTASVNNAGGGEAHNIIQPSLVVNYIIKY